MSGRGSARPGGIAGGGVGGAASVGASPSGMRRLASLGWIASHVFVLAMVVLMLNLGLWQLRRLDDRRADNESIAAAMAQPPINIASGGATVDDHTSVWATGTYLVDAQVRIGNRSSEGQPGHWLATPLRLDDGRAVTVVRGFVARRAQAGPAAGTAAPAGQVSVQGPAFGSVDGARIAATGADDEPEISRMDLRRFEEVSGVEVIDVWIRLRAQSPPQPAGLPAPVPDPDLSDGAHLSYAFQWFFFSAGAVVVYAMILRRAATTR